MSFQAPYLAGVLDHWDLFLLLADESRVPAGTAAGHILVTGLGHLFVALDQLGLAASGPDPIAVTNDFQDLVKGHDLSDMTPGPSPPLFLVGAIRAGLAGLLPPFPCVKKDDVSFHRILAATDRVTVVGGVVDGFTQVLQPIYPVSTEDLALFKRLCFHCFFFHKKAPLGYGAIGSQEGRDGWKTSGLASFRYISLAGGICSFLIHSATLGCRIPKISAVFDCPPRRLTISETEGGVVCVFMMKS